MSFLAESEYLVSVLGKMDQRYGKYGMLAKMAYLARMLRHMVTKLHRHTTSVSPETQLMERQDGNKAVW